jgi:ribonucleoside-diphosphate reductase beta chain
MATLDLTPVFNPTGKDEKQYRKIWFGDSSNIIQLNEVKYDWASSLYQLMRDQFWVPQRVDLTPDVNDYKNLSKDEKTAYDGILSYLIFLDSVQTCNVPHFTIRVTAPEVRLCLGEQISQEQLHSFSYQTMLEAIVESNKRNAIYDFWRTDRVLHTRCQLIAKYYQDFVDDPTLEKYFVALIADFLLEGLYFYNGLVK